jgi:hypothetical protein
MGDVNLPPPEDLPHPPKGDKEGWHKWWQHHNEVWSAYWSATGQNPADGIFTSEEPREEDQES